MPLTRSKAWITLMQQITPIELKEYMEHTDTPPLLLDVRGHEEYQLCHIVGSKHIPMNEIPAAYKELNPNQEIVVICHHGLRSATVAEFLHQSGFTKVMNLAGGINAWAQEIDPDMPVY